MKNVKDCLKNQEESLQKAVDNYLLENDFVERVYSKTNEDDYTYYDSKKGEYYKYVPIKINESEFHQILENEAKIVRLRKNSNYPAAFKFLAIFVFVLGVILGILFASSIVEEPSFWNFIVIVFKFSMLGSLFLGISKILSLLEEIRRK